MESMKFERMFGKAAVIACWEVDRAMSVFQIAGSAPDMEEITREKAEGKSLVKVSFIEGRLVVSMTFSDEWGNRVSDVSTCYGDYEPMVANRHY